MTDSVSSGSVYNISASGNTLPKVINFTANNSHYASGYRQQTY